MYLSNPFAICKMVNKVNLSEFFLLIDWLLNQGEGVEKRKISYFVLARYLIQHWISPNQDDLFHSTRTFISG